MSHRATIARTLALFSLHAAAFSSAAAQSLTPALLAAKDENVEQAEASSERETSLLGEPLLTPRGWESSPRWTVRVGSVLLQRSRMSSYPIATDTNNGETLLNANDFGFPVQGGIDVSALRRGEFCDFDFRYFGVDEWSSQLGPTFFPPGASLGIPGLGTSPDPVLMSRSTYGTQLQSVEFNARRNLTERFTLLAGFRYLQLREKFYTFGSYGPGVFDLDVQMRTRNELYGAQIGADAMLWSAGRLRIEGFGKAGLYGNAAGNLLEENISLFGNLFTLRGNETHAAFVGDINLSAVYQFNDAWAIRGGYQLLWVAGVAIAAEQAHVGNLNTNSAGVDTSGSAFFHGATVGLERSW